jgi:acetylornithine deacetylase/succinyl-diaminopimelate desuccinylase-like protein
MAIRIISLWLLSFVAMPGQAGDAVRYLADYININTMNPPGNEIHGAEFFARIFEREGIEYESTESAPGRGNIWARLKGGDEPALLLLHHMDVVPASPETWNTDPLEAVVKDGKIIGRGTLDTKGLGIVQLQAFLALHRAGGPKKRDVIFMATADEEAGGLLGAGWLIKHRPEIFDNVGYLLNEGGGGTLTGGHVGFTIEVAQKRPYWLRLIARDKPGHGSSPRPTSAPGRLIAALNRIQNAPFEPRIIEPVRRMFHDMAPAMEDKWQAAFLDIDQAIRDPAFLPALQAEHPHFNALTRNTCSITMLSGSEKINVVPPSAQAELDCRILPDQDAKEFLAAIRDRINDDKIEVQEIMLFGPGQSGINNEFYALLRDTIQKHFPGASFVPSVSGGFTDSHFFRDLGITSYGFAPYVIPAEDRSGVHGNNEQISLQALEQGSEIMTEIVMQFSR